MPSHADGVAAQLHFDEPRRLERRNLTGDLEAQSDVSNLADEHRGITARTSLVEILAARNTLREPQRVRHEPEGSVAVKSYKDFSGRFQPHGSWTWRPGAKLSVTPSAPLWPRAS